MAYQSCCCNKLNDITQNEIKTLWTTSYQSCLQEYSQNIQNCIQTRDDGYSSCNEYRDLGYNKCCDWWPCSWGCKALVWISNIVCVSWTWISNVVCIAWETIILTTCVLWTTITNIFWTLNGYISLLSCQLFGLSYAVFSLNGILKNNLENSLQLGFGINTPPNPIAKSGWQLTFNDEFSGSTLDDTKWYKKYINQPNPFSDYQEYIDSGTIPKEYSDDSAIYVSGGSLKLSIEFDPKTFIVKDWNGPIINPATGSPFTVTIDRKIGSIVAKKTESWGDVHPFNQRFGFFEARCKIPSSKATWPAFWLTGFLDWPPEIDIFEIYTSKSNTAFESNYHWGKKDDCFEHSSDVKEHTVNNTSNEFHIYACEWDSCFIKWYYDNMLVRVAHNNVNHVFEPMVLILNNAIQKVPNYESELSLPTFFEIDYVRVYSK